MDIKLMTLIGVALVIIASNYLEKEMERWQIFWIFAVLGLILGIASAYTVAKDLPSRVYYMTFSVLFILMSILYSDESAPAAEAKEKKS